MSESMPPETFREIVRLLWGERWTEPASEALGGVGPRTLQRYAAGKMPIPDWMPERLADAVATRAEDLQRVYDLLGVESPIDKQFWDSPNI